MGFIFAVLNCLTVDFYTMCTVRFVTLIHVLKICSSTALQTATECMNM